MKRSIFFIVTSLLVLSSLLAACQPASLPPQSPGSQQTVQAYIDATLTAQPTATPLPTATNTPQPTLTPTPARIQYGPTNFPADVDPIHRLTG